MTNVSKGMEYATTFEREAMLEKLDAALGELNHMNSIELEALVLKHEQQIKDLAAHLLEIKQLITPMMEFKPEKSLQEPVAWGVFEGNLHDMFFTQGEAQEMADLKGTHAEVRPFYTTSPQPAQKPMHPEIKKMYEDYFDKCFRESSAPPRRAWVGLTDEDMKDPLTHNFDFIDGARWAEAKLKESNK